MLMIQCENCRWSSRDYDYYENQIFYNCPVLQLEYIYEMDNCRFYEQLLKGYNFKPLTNTLEKKDKPPTL